MAISTLSTQISANAGIDTSGGTVLTKPSILPVAVSPSRSTVLAGGGAVGLVLGLILAFVVDRLARRVRDDRDVRRAGASGILTRFSSTSATVPASGGDVDDVRVLRERTLALLGGTGSAGGAGRGGSGVVAVLDATHGVHESDVPVNLALSLAGSGARVSLLLVGYASLLSERLTGDLGLSPTVGPDGVGATFECARVPGVRVHQVSSTSEDLDTGRSARTIFAELLADRDVVVVAVGNQTSHGTQLTAARNADVVLLLADETVHRADLTRTAEELAAVGSPVGGLVLVPRQRKLFASRPGAPSRETPQRGTAGTRGATASGAARSDREQDGRSDRADRAEHYDDVSDEPSGSRSH